MTAQIPCHWHTETALVVHNSKSALALIGVSGVASKRYLLLLKLSAINANVLRSLSFGTQGGSQQTMTERSNMRHIGHVHECTQHSSGGVVKRTQ